MHVLLLTCLSSCAVAADWPSYQGDGLHGDAGSFALIADLAQATKRWESADRIPDGRAADSSDKAHPTISGGFGSPVIAGGRVYLAYYEPTGDAIQEPIAKRAGGPREKWAVLAQDVVHCFDLASGRTLWKRVCPELGMNLNFGNKAGPGQTPLVRDGRLYHAGISGRLHCLDAASGAVLWTTPMRRKAAHVDLERASQLEFAKRGEIGGPQSGAPLPDIGGTYACNRGWLGYPIWAAGVLVVPDYVQAMHAGGKRMPVGGCGGFDPATGRQLWHVPQCAAGRFTNPRTVVVSGAEMVLTVDASGGALIAPADGAVVWRSSDLNQSMGLPIVWKDLVAVVAVPGALAAAEAKARMETGTAPKEPGGGRPAAWRCFRIDAAGAKQIWAQTSPAQEPIVCAVRDGVAYVPVQRAGGGERAEIWAMDIATGGGERFAKPGTAGGEHNNMFTLLAGDRLIACVGGNSGAANDVRDGYCMFTVADGGRKLTPSGAPLRSSFAWGYCVSMLPAIADGTLVFRSNTNLLAYDLRAAN